MYGAAFTPKALDEMSNMLQKYADLLITQLKAAIKVNAIQDLSAWYNFTTFDLTGEFAFGEAFHCLDRGGQYHFFVDTVMNGLVTGLKMQQMQHYGLLTLLKPFIPKSALKPKDDMDQYTKELVDRRLEKDHESGNTDIFTYLLQQKDEEGELSRAALYENAITLVVAGSETTATLLAGATYLLCRNPEMLNKVRSEVRSAFKTDSDITSKSVNNLTYMLAVLTESMRMFPPTAFGLPRFIAAKEGQVTRVAIFHQAAYRSEQNFARPNDFVPERWLPGPLTEFKQDHRDVLQPFMVGPRGCLGKGWAYQHLRPIIENNTDESISLANAETRLLLAKMLWHFDFELADPEDDWLASLKAFMVWERTALRIRLQAVERQYYRDGNFVMAESNPFAIDDTWWCSPLQLLSEKECLFDPAEFELPVLDSEGTDSLWSASTLDLPELAAQNGDQHEISLELLDNPEPLDSHRPASAEGKYPDIQHDIWDLGLDDVEVPKLTQLYTWEAFEKTAVPNITRTAYISEAGSEAFDAALSLEQRHKSTGVLPRDVSLRALCSLALGRSSIFFQWDEAKQSFIQTLSDTPAAGLSALASASVAAELMEYAAIYRKLQDFSSYDKPRAVASPVVVALQRSIASMLEAVEERNLAQMSSVRSILGLQAIVERPWQLLRLLCTLRDAVSDHTTDEAAISTLSDAVHAIVATGSDFADVLTAILTRACRPWLESMAVEVGLIHHLHASSQLANQPDIAGKTFDASVATDCTAELQDDGLLTAEDRTLFNETRATVSLLRSYLPHAVKYADGLVALSTTGPDKYKLPSPDDESQERPQLSDPVSDPQSGEPLSEQDNWASYEAIHNRMSEAPSAVRSNSGDTVYATAITTLAASDGVAPIHEHGLDREHLQRPFDILRPAIEAQACRMNRVLLQYLFKDCRLRKHLDLQRAFHLLDSGQFVSRLSTALFSAETQSAERRRGMMPTAETMGLRLGVKPGQRWPPASSELRLTLAGLLSEVYYDNPATPKPAMAQDDLPGGLSFAIRKLPEAEIELVVADAGSIYALDFLRLHYAAPPPLDSISTPSAMQKYDDAFRFLLRMVRAVYITARMGKNDTRKRHRPRETSTARFASEAHHVTTTLMSYFMDIGISAPWAELQASLDAAEEALEVDMPVTVGINALRDMHHRFLETVRDRLFLRKRQQAVRVAIEEVSTAVLSGAASLQSEAEGETPFIASANAVLSSAVVRLVSILQGIVEKPPKSHASRDSADGDTGVVRLLLAKLDWNSFYARKASS
ncbi:hypothetical protein LTR94_012135 [Friedmanniomyces endolithicus]|nr:hypothetical protein LTR94_012135 [Friedmanniomyces endolithicus]